MLSSSHRFVYLHAPKTAGNAIQSVLLPLSDDHKTGDAPTQDGVDRFGLRGPVTPRKHATLADYEARQPGISEAFRVVLSVRHPFQRAVSLYFSPSSWPSGAAPVWDETRFWTLMNSQAGRALSSFITLPPGPHQGIRRPDVLIRYEDLDHDFQAMLHKLDLPAAQLASLPRLNVSAAPPAQSSQILASRSLRDAVEAQYSEDMEVFGYASYRI